MGSGASRALGSGSPRAASVYLCHHRQSPEITRSSVSSSLKWVRGKISLKPVFD